MATKYTEFDTTPANFVADVRTAILGSADWAQPNAAGKPGLMKATTTRGAQMVVDLSDAAPNNGYAQFGVYRTHDGTTGVDKVVRYLHWKNGNTGANTDKIHCVVSAGKEHLFINTEGPYPSETNTESNVFGSTRTYFYMSDLVPYFDNTVDLVPAVIIGGNHTTAPNQDTSLTYRCLVSRNAKDTVSWRYGKLASLQFPSRDNGPSTALRNVGADGSFFLFPYVLFDDAEGMRGRLNALFFAGFNYAGGDGIDIPTPPVGDIVNYGGSPYKLLAVNKAAQNSQFIWGSLGASYTYNAPHNFKSTVVAVPYST